MSKSKREPQPDLHYIVEELRPFAVPIDSLELDPENARAHGDANRATVRASLLERGQTLPITVRVANRRIMTGNCTVEEMQALGYTHVAALFRDYTEAEAAAWAVAHNRSAELATWDWQQLAQTIADQPDVDWQAVGFEANELEAILKNLETPTIPETTTVGEYEREVGTGSDDDTIPDPPAEPRTKVGDVIQIGRHTLHCCDCMDLLRSLPDNSIDAIVTDAPYGLSPDGRARTWDEIEELRREGKGPKAGFMGKEWDAGVPGISWARECLRVLKPGGHMVAHSATRTIHRLAVAIEDAGFEIRDQIAWLQWQGFPKSLDVSKAIDNAAGAAREVVGEQPIPGAQLQEMSGGGGGNKWTGVVYGPPVTVEAKTWLGWGTALKPAQEPAVLARKPISEATVAANVLRWGTGAIGIDACRMATTDQAWPGPRNDYDGHPLGLWPANIYHCPKPAGTEREAGLEEAGLEEVGCGTGALRDGGRGKDARNIHPTVKPLKLYRWLLRLVTPPGGTVLEPFGGSGTTLVAACDLDCEVIATELSPAYCDIIRARVEAKLASAALP